MIITEIRTAFNREFGKEERVMYEKYVTLRDKRGVSDCKVAESTGIGKSTFSDWKSGRSKPKIEKLAKIAAFFGVPLEYFIKT